jgi:hypothetical protein
LILILAVVCTEGANVDNIVDSIGTIRTEHACILVEDVVTEMSEEDM